MPIRRVVLGFASCAVLTACLPRERINRSCEWIDDTAALPAVGDPARRAHLIVDVRVAEDLGIRRGDSVGGRSVRSPEHLAATAKCIAELKQEIMRRHGVSAAEVESVVGAREIWVDLTAVFLPMMLVYLLGSHLLARRIITTQSFEDTKVAALTLLCLTPVVAALGLSMTGQFAWLVEYLRSGSEHISFRASYLPHARHGWLVWGIGMMLYAGVAVRALRQPRVTGGPTRRGLTHAAAGTAPGGIMACASRLRGGASWCARNDRPAAERPSSGCSTSPRDLQRRNTHSAGLCSLPPRPWTRR